MGFFHFRGYPRGKKWVFRREKIEQEEKMKKRILGGFFQRITKQKRLKVEISQFLAGSKYERTLFAYFHSIFFFSSVNVGGIRHFLLVCRW